MATETTSSRPGASDPASPPAPKRLRTDVLLMLANKALVMVLNVATTVVTARELGLSGRGVVAVAFSLSLLLVQIGSFGLVTANPYFVAKDVSSPGRIVTNSLWFAGILGTLLIAAGALIKLALPGVVEGLDWTQLVIVLAGIPAALAAVYLQSILLGEGRTIAYNLTEVAFGAISLAAIAIALYGLDLGVTAVLVVLAGTPVISAATYIVLLLRHRPKLAAPDLQLARTMLRYAFRIYIATLLAFLVIRLDLLLVNYYLGSEQAGAYSVAAALAAAMFVIPSVIGTNLFPRVARGSGSAATAEIFRCVAVLYGVLCIATVPLAEVGVRIAFGEEYASSATLYYWLVPGVFSLGMLTVLSNHFAGRGFPLEAMLVWFVGLAVNVGMNVLLLPSHGTYVASLSASVAYIVLLVLHVRLFARELGGYSALRPGLRETVRFVATALGREPVSSAGTATR